MSLRKSFILMLLVGSFCAAQQPSWQWARNVGVQVTDPFIGLGYETFVSSVATDKEGNVYVAGVFSDSISVDGFAVYSIPNNFYPEQVDVFVAKYDAQGKLLWLKQFGSPLSDEVNGAAVDADNHLYICGQYGGTLLSATDTLIETSINENGFNGYIVRCSPEGDFHWAIPCHTKDKQTTTLGISAMRQTIIIAGKTSGNGGMLQVGDQQIPNDRTFVAKINTDGNVGWLQQIPTESSERMGVSVLPNGESFVAIKNNIVKYDSQGNLIKTLTIGGGTVTAIASNKDLVCGVGLFRDTITAGDITFTQPNVGMFAATYSHDGNLKNLRIGVSQHSDANGVCADSAGGFYATGTFLQSIRFDDNIGVADSLFCSYVVRFGSDYRSTLVATSRKDGASCILGTIATTSANEAVTSGSFYRSVEFPPFLLTGASWYPDVVVAKLKQTPSSFSSQEELSQLSLFPSPASNILNISYKLTSASTVIITLFDLLGREIARVSEGILPEGKHLIPLNVSSVPNGVYCLRLQTGYNTETQTVHIVK